MDQDIISSYTAQQAEEDGYLVPIFSNRWASLSDGRSIYATAKVFQDISLAGLMEIWNEYIEKAKTLHEMELFRTKMNGSLIWVMFDGSVFTILYPEEY